MACLITNTFGRRIGILPKRMLLASYSTNVSETPKGISYYYFIFINSFT